MGFRAWMKTGNCFPIKKCTQIRLFRRVNSQVDLQTESDFIKTRFIPEAAWSGWTLTRCHREAFMSETSISTSRKPVHTSRSPAVELEQLLSVTSLWHTITIACRTRLWSWSTCHRWWCRLAQSACSFPSFYPQELKLFVKVWHTWRKKKSVNLKTLRSGQVFCLCYTDNRADPERMRVSVSPGFHLDVKFTTECWP